MLIIWLPDLPGCSSLEDVKNYYRIYILVRGCNWMHVYLVSCYWILIATIYFLLFSSAVLPLSQPCCKLVSAPVTHWQRKTMREWDGIAMCVSVLKCFHMQCWPVYGSPTVNKQPPLLLSAKLFVTFVQCLLGGWINTHKNVSNERKQLKKQSHSLPNRCILPIFHSKTYCFHLFHVTE